MFQFNRVSQKELDRLTSISILSAEENILSSRERFWRLILNTYTIFWKAQHDVFLTKKLFASGLRTEFREELFPPSKTKSMK